MLVILLSLICSGIVSIIFSLIWSVIPENGLTKLVGNIIITIISFFIFYYFYKKYYSISWKKSLGVFLVYSALSTIIALIIIIPIRTFVFQPFYVKGDSMNPTYKNNDYLFVSLLNTKFSKGDIIIVRKKDKPNNFLIKRIIGTPGETIDTTALNNQQYFVLSDNHSTNVDNGIIEKSEIFGKVIYKAWPMSN
jgi:signal peptidase I